MRVLAPGNNDAAEDGLHACAPSVIKRTRNAAEGGYLLYYECARRIYDRARNFSNDVGFAQVCGATSDDGTAWRRLKDGAPLITAAPRVLENCSYAFMGGRHTIDTGRPACSLANQINNYGVGHPSAVIVANGSSNAIWLYYYDSKGDWAQHGVYLAKSQDGINFGSAVKTNLPNDAHVKYFAGRFGGWDHVFLATTVIGKTNGILVSGDGVNWLPADGSVIDAGVASGEHCATPGTGSSSATTATISSRCPSPSYRRKDIAVRQIRDRRWGATPRARTACGAAAGRPTSCRARSGRSCRVVEHAHLCRARTARRRVTTPRPSPLPPAPRRSGAARSRTR